MVEVRIDEDVLVEMLIDRLREFWRPSDEAISLFEDYYTDLAYNGAFDGVEFDVSAIVDNDWVNNLSVISKEEFEDYGIEDEDDERIAATNNRGLFLIYNF